jgi:hypothetical protein
MTATTTLRRPPIRFVREGMARPPDETILPSYEIGLKHWSAGMASIKQRGSIMLDFILNLFYRQSCKTALSAIRMQHRIWA